MGTADLTERHALIGVGGNVGTEAEICARFLAAEERLVARLSARAQIVHTRWSPLHASAQRGPVRDQPRFVNGVLALEASAPLEARALLADLLAIEAQLGRIRPAPVTMGPRTIDLDLLFVGDACIVFDGPPALTLPHPRICERAFVLMPLADLMGRDWRMPGFARTVADCLRDEDVARQVPTVTRLAEVRPSSRVSSRAWRSPRP